MRQSRLGLTLLAVALVFPALQASSADGGGSGGGAARDVERALPRYDHVVVAVFENKPRADVLRHAPYFAHLADRGADMKRSYAVTHPSEPNYIALYSGGLHGVHDDSCPHRLAGKHLGAQLAGSGHSFRAYSEGLPGTGSTVCTSGTYARKHAPWVNFSSFKQRRHRPFGRFPDDYTKLPTVAFVVPDLCHDTHDCSLAKGNRWLKRNLGDYSAWARSHNSLLVVTFDEDDRSADNHIYTVLVGAGIDPGHYRQRIDHYSVLRTLEKIYALPALGHAADRRPIHGIW